MDGIVDAFLIRPPAAVPASYVEKPPAWHDKVERSTEFARRGPIWMRRRCRPASIDRRRRPAPL